MQTKMWTFGPPGNQQPRLCSLCHSERSRRGPRLFFSVILSRCGEESRRTLLRPALARHALTREILRYAQDDAKKVLTGTKSRILVLVLGAGVTPAQGSVKPTAGFT